MVNAESHATIVSEEKMNKKLNGLRRDRIVYKQLRPKLTQLEKMWLLDVGGDYRLYIARLYKLSADHGIEIPSE
jgi:hypothetical protein